MLKLFNTLTKKVEEFKPLKKKSVGIYVCGPTVYSPDHLGHIRTWLFFDWLRRYYLANGYKVKFVQNITDVGHLVGDAEEGVDKIEKQAKEENKTPEEIARFYENEHFKDLAALNILKPDYSPRATEHIKDIISFIEVLIKKGNAYEKDGNVYFDVESFKDYGKLSSRKLDESRDAVRVEKDPKKKNPMDFALWLKADPEHLQKWPSPWGEGYPGWHIECSVMAPKYLGQPFDIHGGASDLIFPHHENEIAQSQAFANKPLATYFLHAGMLLINGQKMAKSEGNFVTIKDALAEFDPDTIKLAFMTTHWKKPFNWPARHASQGDAGGDKHATLEAEKVKARLVRAKEQAQLVKTGYKTEINLALEEDFNVPMALAVIMKNLSKLSREDFAYIEKLFGLELKSDLKLTEKQEKMVKEREGARKRGDFKEADAIRDELKREGIIVEDTKTGPHWSSTP